MIANVLYLLLCLHFASPLALLLWEIIRDGVDARHVREYGRKPCPGEGGIAAPLTATLHRHADRAEEPGRKV